MRSRTPQERAVRAISFDSDPELYERNRPTYPPEIYESLWRLAGLSSTPQVLEVGCGTGQASVELARRGSVLTCVDFGAHMAGLARQKLSAFPSARVIVAKFEDWDPGEERFDLVFAASSWHWIDPELGPRKAASVLREGGHLAILSSGHAYPAGYDPLYNEIHQAYAEVTGEAGEWPPKPPEEAKDHREELLEGGWFDKVDVARHLWSFERDADGYVDLLATFSDNRVREPAEREQLFERIRGIIARSPTGRIRKDYLSILRVAHKAPLREGTGKR